MEDILHNLLSLRRTACHEDDLLLNKTLLPGLLRPLHIVPRLLGWTHLHISRPGLRTQVFSIQQANPSQIVPSIHPDIYRWVSGDSNHIPLPGNLPHNERHPPKISASTGTSCLWIFPIRGLAHPFDNNK